ncbi:hypothetical protein JW933_02955, partial [candidate division FCPU426 bacterium]|nr:hypothetical protein [candidate division FCPU426 bacterium]
MARKTVALFMALAFLLPAVSWAFDLDNYFTPQILETRLGNPESLKLSQDFSVPGSLGKVLAAHQGTGSMTFVLIQDLHCHAQIQGHIRSMLENIMARHPDIRLLAEEGASGIIPLAELAALPDSLEKRAVAEYFVRQGKMTAADWYVISGHPQAELFGAEDQALYDQSLDLIRTFVTEENHGLLLEMADQLEMLQEKLYHPELLAFERRRRFYQKTLADQTSYYQDLLREAQRRGIILIPAFLGRTSTIANLGYYQQLQHQQYLENEILKQLLRTAAEKKLFAKQQYLEICERILNVSAAREDLQRYQEASASLSLSGLARELAQDPGYVHAPEDIKQLEQAIGQALVFYRLAGRRDQALLQNTMQRLQDRGEKRAVLITGGFHTQALEAAIEKAGHSYVTLQPNMTGPEANSQYFELLRDPGRLTELESIIAQTRARAAAIAVPKGTANPFFAFIYRNSLGIARLARRVLNNERIPRLRNVSFKKSENSRYVEVSTAAATYYISLNRTGLFVGKSPAELAERMGDPSVQPQNRVPVVFSLPTARIAGLAMAGLGAIMFLTGTFAGLGTALIAGSLVLLLLWEISHLQAMSPQQQRKAILLLSCFAGASLLMFFGGPLLGELTNHFCANDSVPYLFTNTMLGGIKTSINPVV